VSRNATGKTETELETEIDDAARAVGVTALHEKRDRDPTENRLVYYKPYPRQARFHAAGALSRERLLMAGNQLGKTLAGGFEAAMHMTGSYPDWWEGKRFGRPVVGWVCGRSGEDVRDGMQRILLGRPGQRGTGSIPKDAIAELVPARGVAGLYDIIRVAHVSGGVSVASTKSYKAGREAFQGETLDFVSFDEEPPANIYTEGLTRTNIGAGPVWLTFTPLLGMSEVVRRFLLEPSPDRSVTQMTIDDVTHYTAEERARIIASYPPHEREARIKGVPVLGSGRIFPVPEEDIACTGRELPGHWPRIGGMDFGYDHPFAAVELVWDRDTDTVYVTRSYRHREGSPVLHAAALRPWGKLPWAWPRDGSRETLEGAGVALAKQYGAQGLDMLVDHAQFEDGSVSVEAGLMDMLDRMKTGRFKVLHHLNDWFEEFRLYHRKDGRVVKEGDDLMAATRYALMMLRHARTTAALESFRRPIAMPNLSVA
jgi:phage terminase large subunit-like protein